MRTTRYSSIRACSSSLFELPSAAWSEPLTHDSLESVDDTELHLIGVELKDG
jgi:hypothetical protein